MKSGIYKITNLVNNKCYIGLSNNIKVRRISHFAALRGNSHFNIYLQNSYNKYGESNFKFEVLEHCEENILSEKEIYYIAKFDSFNNGYNLTPGGESGTKGKYNGHCNLKKYTFYNLDGVTIEESITCIDMIEKYNLGENSHIHSVASGNREASDGWVINKEFVTQSRKGSKYTFYNLNGEITEKITQAEFNVQYNINNDAAVSCLILGKVKSCKGWFLSKEDLDNYNSNIKESKRSVINKQGEIINDITQKEFRDLTGCDSCSSSQLFNGKYKTVRGYKLF